MEPNLSPQWPPTNDQIAEIANGLHWQVQELGYDLGVRPHTVTTERRMTLAYDMAAFADLLRRTDPGRTVMNSGSNEYTPGHPQDTPASTRPARFGFQIHAPADHPFDPANPPYEVGEELDLPGLPAMVVAVEITGDGLTLTVDLERRPA